MYGYKTIQATLTTGTTLSTALQCEGYQRATLEVPTFAVGVVTATCNVYLQGSDTKTGTYRRIREMGVYSGISGLGEWETPSSAGNFMVAAPIKGIKWAKVEFSKTTTLPVGTKLHCYNDN